MKNKRKCQKSHFLRRLKERFGISLNKGEFKQLCRLIKNQKAKFIEKQSCRITLWDVTIKNKQVRVVYDKKRKVVVTALYNPQEIWSI